MSDYGYFRGLKEFFRKLRGIDDNVQNGKENKCAFYRYTSIDFYTKKL